MFSTEKLRSMLEGAMPGAKVSVLDSTGTNDHFEVTVVSTLFEGKGPVERHRMIYGAIGPAMGGDIHALSLRTLTPQEEK